MKCKICGYNRIIEKRHIIPKYIGDGKDKNNMVYLCPTHHKLLDYGILNNEEIYMLENNIIKLINDNKVKNNIQQVEYLYYLLGIIEKPHWVKRKVRKDTYF